MPTYVYRCDSCDHQFEVFQKMSDDALDTCPQCEAKIRRVLHPVGIVFKGSGWYINDSKSSGKSSTTESPAASSDTGSSESKTTDTSSAKEPAKAAAD